MSAASEIAEIKRAFRRLRILIPYKDEAKKVANATYWRAVRSRAERYLRDPKVRKYLRVMLGLTPRRRHARSRS